MAQDDIPLIGPFDQPWQTKGEVTSPYGEQDLGQPSDGDQADAAFERMGQGAGSAPDAFSVSSQPPKEAGEAKAPVETQRQPQAPRDVWATGAGEKNSKLQAP